jgi:hypothetical protein
VNRADFARLLAGAAATPVGGTPSAPTGGTPISAEIAVERESSELLAPVRVTIAVRNPTTHSVPLEFPTADIYRIDVLRDEETVWSTASGHKPLPIARRIDVAPGLTRLAGQIIDGTTDDHRAYAPGRYTIRVAMLGATLDTTVDRPVSFEPPRSIADARKAPRNTVLTIAGTPAVDAGTFTLGDASGSIRLSRPLGLHPTGEYVVRGSLDALGDEPIFAVSRSAPAYANTGSGAAP